LAHPVLAVLAEAALATGDDLLGHHVVADGHVVPFGGTLTQGGNRAGELVARHHGSLAVAAPAILAPEEHAAGEALDVAGADARGANLDQDLARSRLWPRDLLYPVIVRPMAHHGLHRLGRHRLLSFVLPYSPDVLPYSPDNAPMDRPATM